MLDTETVQRLYDQFTGLAMQHPFISVPIVSFFLLSVIVSTGKGVLDFFSSVKEKMGWPGVAGVLLGLLAISGIATAVLRAVNKPRPEITTGLHRVLSSDYTIRWKYMGHESGLVKYVVETTNRLTKEKREFRTPLPHYRVDQKGPLAIRITAEWPNGNTATSKEFDLEIYPDSLSRITSTMSMVVGVHVDHSEGVFCFVDRSNGEIQGFDIDLAKLIREELKKRYGLEKLDFKIRSLSWDEVLDRAQSYDIDFAVASISITPEREKRVLFSHPYWETHLATVFDSEKHVELGGQDAVPVSKLAGLKVGAHKSTTAEAFVQSLMGGYTSIQLMSFEDNQALFSALGNAAIDAAVYDLYRSFAEIKSHPTWAAKKLDAAGMQGLLTPERYGIAFAPVNSSLRNEVNKILLEHKEVIKEMIGRRLATRTT